MYSECMFECSGVFLQSVGYTLKSLFDADLTKKQIESRKCTIFLLINCTKYILIKNMQIFTIYFSCRTGLLFIFLVTPFLPSHLLFGPHFLCWISWVVSFTTWLISRWEVNKYCYMLIKCTKWHLFHSKWQKLSFWVKIAVILSVAQLVTTVIFFSAWDKSRVKWDNSPILKIH